MSPAFPPAHLMLEDDRVLLRPLVPEDLVLLMPYAENEPEIWKYSNVPVAGKDGMTAYFNAAFHERDQHKEFPFIVFDKQTAEWAGCTRFYDIQPVNATTQLGYTWYGAKFQRTGLNRHCKLLLLTYAFETWGLERVEFRADAGNSRSIAAMQQIGCTVEGILRSHTVKPGGRRDSIVLSILKSEWFGGVKAALIAKTR